MDRIMENTTIKNLTGVENTKVISSILYHITTHQLESFEFPTMFLSSMHRVGYFARAQDSKGRLIIILETFLPEWGESPSGDQHFEVESKSDDEEISYLLNYMENSPFREDFLKEVQESKKNGWLGQFKFDNDSFKQIFIDEGVFHTKTFDLVVLP